MSILICLDPGHGGTDRGAVGLELKEKDVCLDICYRIEKELQKYDGIRVTLTRSYDVDITAKERVDWANSRQADLFLSVHTINRNHGFASYVSVIAGSEDRRLQCWLHNQIASFFRNYGVYDNGKKNDTETEHGLLYELRCTKMPAITLAALNLSHPKEHRLANDSSFRGNYAKSIAEGLAKIYQCNKHGMGQMKRAFI
jgi:N-acetylmuramoyl-L-alanine amidase